VNRIGTVEELEQKIASLYEEIEVVEEMRLRCANVSEREDNDQEALMKRFEDLSARGELLREALNNLKKEKDVKKAKALRIKMFVHNLENQEQGLSHFDERLWNEVMDHILVRIDGSLDFVFWNGSTINMP